MTATKFGEVTHINFKNATEAPGKKKKKLKTEQITR